MVYLTSLLNPTSSYVLPQPLSVTTTNPVTSLSATILNSSIEISNDVGNAVPVTITNSISTIPGGGTQLVSYADSPQLDSNQRLRVVLPSQSWWYASSVDKDGDLRLIESFTTGASSIFVQNLASVTMTSGTSLTGSAIRATRRRFKVRPGVSHQWSGALNWDGRDTGTIKRVGMFTNFNGMFFELSGTDFNVVARRRLTDGTFYEERVNQNNFNIDKLNGNGPSGQNWSTVLSGAITAGTTRWPITISSTIVYNTEFTYTNGPLSAIKLGSKATISGVTPSGYNGTVAIAAVNTATNKLTATYVIDPGSYSSVTNAKIVNTGYHNMHSYFIEFGGGRTTQLHFGIDSTAGPSYLHAFDFSNQLGIQYESAPALMERKEILNYSAMAYNPTMTVDGTSFTVEAEVELNPAFGVAYNNNGIAIPTNDLTGEHPVLGIGIRTGEPYQRADIKLESINIMDIANTGTGGTGSNASKASVMFWRLLFNPGLSGVPTPINIGKTSRKWEYTTSTSLTGSSGIELLAGNIISSSTIDIRAALNFLNMGSNIEYTDADKIVLTVRQLAAGSSNANVIATMNYIEDI